MVEKNAFNRHVARVVADEVAIWLSALVRARGSSLDWKFAP